MRFPLIRSTTIPLAVGTIAGAVVIAGLTFGYYGWSLFVWAALIGLAAGIPVGLWSARQLREAEPIDRPASPSMDPEASRREVKPGARIPYPPATTQGEA